MAVDVVLATCSEFPAGEDDELELVATLAELSVHAEWRIWDDPGAHWDDAPVVVRSTWDYTPRRDQFLAWTRAVGHLHNPAELIAWNSDKTYLRDLATAELPIVPTTWATPGKAYQFPDGEFVVKPSVGAGSRGVGRFTDPDQAQGHVAALFDAGRTVMIQPYQADVDSAGETALVYFDGEFSHAIRKAPMLPEGTVHTVEAGALFVPEQITARVPSAAERSVGDAILAYLKPTPLYVRVDLLPGLDGPVIVELELVEPSLFLSRSDGAMSRFAHAVKRRLV